MNVCKSHLFLAIAAGVCLAAVPLQAAEAPKDLQGAWAPAKDGCSEYSMDNVKFLRSDALFFKKRCVLGKAICSFWKEPIKEGDDCTINLECADDYNHGVLMMNFTSRNSFTIHGSFDKSDPSFNDVQQIDGLTMRRCK